MIPKICRIESITAKKNLLEKVCNKTQKHQKQIKQGLNVECSGIADNFQCGWWLLPVFHQVVKTHLSWFYQG